MVRVYKRKTGVQQWSKIDMCSAIEAVRNKTMTYSEAAIKFDVPRTTLKRRSNKTADDKNILQNIKLGRFTSTFSKEQESELQKFLLEMDTKFFGLSSIELRRIVFQYAEANKIPHNFNKEKGAAGPDWYKTFTQRHADLALRSVENTSSTYPHINKFFDLLTDLMDKYNFPPSRIYNVDETGITTVPNEASFKQVFHLSSESQVGAITSGTTVTTTICYSAAGNFIPPLMIFPWMKSDPEFQDCCPPETLLVFHPSGWMQKEIFCPTWFNHFTKNAKPQDDDPVLLILDGKVSHVRSLALIKSAAESNVHILCLPPNTAQKTEPLDRCFMNPLRTYYSQHCSAWFRNHPGQVISLKSMSKIFGEAYMRAAVPQNAISGFKASGIYPMNKYIFADEKFAPAATANLHRS